MANTPERHFSRRTLAKGAAWSVPVVAVAAAAPAYAQSLLNTKPSNVTATRVDCDTANVTWTGIEGAYELQGFNGTDWTPTTPTAATDSSNGVVSVTRETITKVRVRQVAGTAVSDWVESENLPAITGPTEFTFRDAMVEGFYAFTWTTTAVLASSNASFSVQARNKDETAYTTLGATTSSSRTTSIKWDGDAILTTTVCGLTFTAQWPVNGLLREPSPNNAGVDTAENTQVETPATEPQNKGKQLAESKAPAAKKSAPTIEPTPTPTPTPEPSVSMAPDPEPIVTESVVVPEPVPVPTPSA